MSPYPRPSMMNMTTFGRGDCASGAMRASTTSARLRTSVRNQFSQDRQAAHGHDEVSGISDLVAESRQHPTPATLSVRRYASSSRSAELRSRGSMNPRLRVLSSQFGFESGFELARVSASFADHRVAQRA